VRKIKKTWKRIFVLVYKNVLASMPSDDSYNVWGILKKSWKHLGFRAIPLSLSTFLHCVETLTLSWNQVFIDIALFLCWYLLLSRFCLAISSHLLRTSDSEAPFSSIFPPNAYTWFSSFPCSVILIQIYFCAIDYQFNLSYVLITVLQY